MSDSLLIQHDGSVCTLTINRPRIRNAVDADTMLGVRDAVEACGPETRVLVLTGAGGAFCSGADISVAASGPMTPDTTIRILTDAYHPALLALRNAPFPVIAAVDGVAAGIGCDIALACDLRLVSARGRFAELFVQVGLVPDGGGTYTLPRLVGLGRALEMMYTGVPVDANEAVRIGLANRVLPTETFMDDVAAFAATLATQAPLSLQRIRKAVYAAQEGSFEEALQREAQFQYEIFSSEDGFEGFRAFLEKRPPVWKGR